MNCFFIGGINRSGTTLLQSILCSDRTTNPLIHEASYLRQIVEAYDFGIQKFDEHNRYYFSSKEELRQFTARWAIDFIGQVRRMYPGTENVVLKHPPITRRFPVLFDLLYPTSVDPRFLVIIRDPRDVVASLVQVGERLRQSGDPEGATLPRDMERLGNYYMMTYMPALSFDNSEYQQRTTLIKYEDLVTDPTTAITRMREFTGLALDNFDSDTEWKNDNLDYKQLGNDRNAWLSELWGKPISNTHIGNYRHILSPGEIKAIESICSAPLKTFGYL